MSELIRRGMMTMLRSSGDSINWQEWTASRDRSNISDSANDLFSGYTRASGHMYVAILVDKVTSDMPENQLVGLVSPNTSTGGGFVRYRSSALNYSSGAAISNDAVIITGDKYMIADIPYTS